MFNKKKKQDRSPNFQLSHNVAFCGRHRHNAKSSNKTRVNIIAINIEHRNQDIKNKYETKNK